MKRRDVIKGLAATAGVFSWQPRVFAFGQDKDAKQKASFAMPIRGLMRRDGKQVQPIQITVDAQAASAECITRVDQQEVDRRTLSAGAQTFLVYTDAVSAARKAVVTCECGGKSQSAEIQIEPVRKVQIYVLPHSHHDLGYTDLQANVVEKQMANITRGIEAARNTASYPEGARFIWNLEVLWGADQYMRRKSQAERDELVDAIRKGWIGINGMYANELTGLCRPEELVQLFRFGNELGRQCGVPVNSAMISDVPGYTWGTVTAMVQAGIRYFSAAPNFFDRIGDFMVAWQDRPFWWVSPSGKEKVLFWVPWTGYAMSHIMKLDTEWVSKYQARLDEVSFPYEISYIRWSGHGDNAVPDPEICEFIKKWNAEYEWPQFTIARTGDAFAAFEKRYGSQIPERKGDLTPYWEDGAGSSAVETSLSRMAAERITQASTLAAMLAPKAYVSADFHEAWRNVLLYSEHTWGAWNSVSDSENPFVTKQWQVKRQFALDADSQSKKLLESVLQAYASGADSSAIDIHNSNSWPRTDVVLLSKEMSAGKDHVKSAHGASVPSQRLSTGELAFLAEDVPAFGSARYHLSAGKPHKAGKKVAVHEGVLDNDLLRVRLDSKTGDIVELVHGGTGRNLIDTSQSSAANQYLYLEGKDISKLQTSGAVQISMEEPGPLVATLRIESSAPGCNSLVRRVSLKAHADWVEMSNVLDKKRVPLNPHPGEGNQGGEFAQHESKESVQFAFPFAVDGGQIHVDIPLGVMRPEIDQLPGSCKNWLPVGRWVDVANGERGVTWATLDAPLIEVGEVSATMLGSQTHPEIWRKHIEPTQKFYSWAINNHWGTNYRAYQQGIIEFRYAVRPHAGYNAAEASRFATGLSQPLVASNAGIVSPSAMKLRVTPEDVLVQECMRSADGNAWIVRLFGASGEDRTAEIAWEGNESIKISRSNLSEEPLEPAGKQVSIGGLELITLRIETND
ncbi:glycoside hydrolase family 38 C-terminal domain-containing protein [Acidicapsa dinghuensis]|uniref:Glycoside hydrolase family 38 C-terminal domain-containing protein n=1 Tax=Acidicapsa dinghuensis TaxID=2218256 RepID=A0ABW1ER32_9BACT|nr:glycoside hydrolase family 38 C-terminal domain-containing protein [Acidicapsa dinghuensis]